MSGDSHSELGLQDEVIRLADAVATGRATEQQQLRLDQLVCESDEACWAYVRYMHDTVAIHRRAQEVRLAASFEQPQVIPDVDETRSNASSVRESAALLSALSEAENQGMPYVLQNHLVSGQRAPGRTLRHRFLRFCASMSVAVVIAIGGVAAGWWMSSATNRIAGSRGTPQRIAKIIRAVEPVWTLNGKPMTLTTGDWLMTGRYTLTAGLAQIVFPWGTEVTLEAPLDIEFTPDGERRLQHGQLVAKVSPEDTGFTIDTPTVKLIDLGTEFGLSTDVNGGSEIHVFKGAVEARPHFVDESNASSITMLTGDANRFATDEAPVHHIAFNPKRFSRAWRLNSRVSETTGALRFVHPAPRSVAEGDTESNQDLVMFLEREREQLADPVAVTFTEPGLYTNFTDKVDWLPGGIEVDSYLVHFDPIGSKNDQAAVVAQGAVTFDRPILAVIARGDQLAGSDQWFASPSTQYQGPAILKHKNRARFDASNIFPAYAIRGLTGLWNRAYSHESPAPNDWLRLSADRKTLIARCAAGGEANHFRIIVAVDDQERPPVSENPGPRSSKPYHGKPFVAGQTIEAEDFDLGGQDVAYYDTTPDSLSNVYRPSDSVELRSYVTGEHTDINVSIARAGEWLAYTVDIEKPGKYVVKASAGSMLAGGQFRFEFGESAASPPVATQSLAVPVTKLEEGDRAEWFGTAISTPVDLKAGKQIMRVVMEANHASGRLGNFDWFRIEPADTPAQEASRK